MWQQVISRACRLGGRAKHLPGLPLGRGPKRGLQRPSSHPPSLPLGGGPEVASKGRGAREPASHLPGLPLGGPPRRGLQRLPTHPRASRVRRPRNTDLPYPHQIAPRRWMQSESHCADFWNVSQTFLSTLFGKPKTFLSTVSGRSPKPSCQLSLTFAQTFM